MSESVGLTGRDEAGGGVTIKLETVPERNTLGFILANRMCATCRNILPPFGCACPNPVALDHVPLSAEGSKRGKSLLIAGAGPSLATLGHEFATHSGEVWATNSALAWCLSKGYRVDRAVAIDASPRMVTEVWPDPWPGEYLLATSVNPVLTAHLLAAGASVTQFHSARSGSGDEFNLYRTLYPPTFIAGRGLNVVNRAAELAAWLGYARIKLVGIDHAYANGRRYADGRGPRDGDVLATLDLDGRKWVSNPDMLYCAIALVHLRNEIGRSRLKFCGDVLPKALQDKTDSFLAERVMDWEPTHES